MGIEQFKNQVKHVFRFWFQAMFLPEIPLLNLSNVCTKAVAGAVSFYNIPIVYIFVQKGQIIFATNYFLFYLIISICFQSVL